jgi:3'-5' exoribonuclease
LEIGGHIGYPECMARSKPPVVRLCELTPGQHADFFALLADKARNQTRGEGKPFYLCRFRDNRRTVSFAAWSDSPWFAAAENEWQAGRFFKLRGVYGEHERYGPQIVEISAIREVRDEDRNDGFDPTLLIERSRREPAEMFAELKALVAAEVRDEPLRRLTLTLLEKHADAWQRLPATRDRFHTFTGGLLEHTLSVTRSCMHLVERYAAHYVELKPPLNRDLVLAGAVLHDIGRVLEMGDEPVAPALTVAGRLEGHVILGRDLVRDAAREQGDVNPELLLLLEHLILTHLTLPEWGSPRLPLIPEALILHHADDLDAKMELYIRCLSRDQAAGPFTDRDPLLNRQLFKGRSV